MMIILIIIIINNNKYVVLGVRRPGGLMKEKGHGAQSKQRARRLYYPYMWCTSTHNISQGKGCWETGQPRCGGTAGLRRGGWWPGAASSEENGRQSPSTQQARRLYYPNEWCSPTHNISQAESYWEVGWPSRGGRGGVPLVGGRGGGGRPEENGQRRDSIPRSKGPASTTKYCVVRPHPQYITS